MSDDAGHPTSGFDELVHQPNRLAILVVLEEAGQADFAYLKRQVEDRPSAADADTNGDVATVASHEVKAKYRDPKTNETWSGRGRMATWLKRKQDAGEDIEAYRV